MHIQNGHRFRRDERLLAGKHLVEHHAETIQVAAYIELTPMTLLRAHVVRGAKYVPGGCIAGLVLTLLRQAEIDERERSIGSNHHVAWLQIPMQDADLVDHL